MAELTTTLEGKRPKGRAAAAQSQATDAPNDKVRVSLDISPELNEKLQAMARDINGTRSEVLRKSLVLFDLAIEARKQGKKMGLRTAANSFPQKLLGFRPLLTSKETNRAGCTRISTRIP